MALTLQTLYGTAEQHGRYGVLIYDLSSCAAISCTVTRRFSFTMASTAAMASGGTTRCAWPDLGESVTDLTPFRNFLFHSYTCCSDRHASPYWTSIRRWISMGFTPSLRKKRMTERCSSLVHVASGPPSLHYCCAVVLRSSIVLPPVGHFSKPWVSLLPTYRTIERCFEFLSHY